MANAYTILVVDDEPPIRRFLRTSLSAAGYQVVTADDAASGLAGLAREKPDVIILDLGRPDGSGLGVSAEPRQGSPVPISGLSPRAGGSRRSRRDRCDR